MKTNGAHVTVTAAGVIAFGIWAVVWVTALAYGFYVPESWLGHLLKWKLGLPIITFGTIAVLIPVGKLLESRGIPFFRNGHASSRGE